MAVKAIYRDLKPVEVPLEYLYLDPNNPRFVGANWQDIPESEIGNESVQETARLELVKNFGVEKLRMNMEVNGYLAIDRVIVREFNPGKFVLLEGNRRICAAKMITNVGIDGSAVGGEVLESLKLIPCLQYVGSEQDAAWIFQGIRHITGIMEWSAYNKARLLVDQIEEEHLKLGEAGKRFGLTAFGAGQWVRGYYAFKQAREKSDYVHEVDERSYPYFQELFSRSSIAVREWLEWDDGANEFRDTLHLNEFVGWLYPRENASDEQGSTSESKGNWDDRCISTRDGIRWVAFLIRHSNPTYFQQFRMDHDLDKAYTMAQSEVYQHQATEKADRVRAVFESVTTCTKALEDVPLKMVRDQEIKGELKSKLENLNSVVSDLLKELI